MCFKRSQTKTEVWQMSIIAWIVLGLLAGWIAGLLMRGGGYGLVGDIILGVLGAIVGGWLTGVLLGVDLMTGFNVQSLVVAVLGAVVLIGISRLFSGGRAVLASDHLATPDFQPSAIRACPMAGGFFVW